MFFLPVNTDAPVYHWPWATLSLIVVNTLAFFAAAVGLLSPDTASGLMLAYGDGLHPLQWVTSIFLHDGIMHLLGNMFFLWGLGIVVEGKIGWQKFLPVYLLLGIGESALEQACFLGSHGQSLGASSAIFGIMAMALVWAPKNDLSIFYGLLLFVFFRFGVFEITILTFSLLMIGQELLFAWLLDFHTGAAAVHLLGAALGFVLGTVMLRNHWVDCEGWDLFSVIRGDHRRSLTDPYRYVNAAYQRMGTSTRSSRLSDDPRDQSEQAHGDEGAVGQVSSSRGISRLRELLADKKFGAACRELQRLQRKYEGFQLPQRELRALSCGMLRSEKWDEAVALLAEYVERFPDDSELVRIKLAEVLISRQRRPRAALRMIASIDRERLHHELVQRCNIVELEAYELIDSGVIELSGRAWE